MTPSSDLPQLCLQATPYYLGTVDAGTPCSDAEAMMRYAPPKTLLAIVALLCTLAAGPASAGYMDFTVDSLRVEETGGC